MKKRQNKQEETKVGISCLRCGTELMYAGKFKFHEGTRWGFVGGIFELAVNREPFDVCKCPKCGSVEFFDLTFRNINKADGEGNS
jgi:predicted nucleic-acid-binding Zn-ribbon protein